MAKYRKKPVVVDATQWFKNGDHPQDSEQKKDVPYGFDPEKGNEGAVVRFYRHPDVEGTSFCDHCHHMMNKHGWLEYLKGGRMVCPGDWIVTHTDGCRYALKPDIFAATYEIVEGEVPRETKVDRIVAAVERLLEETPFPGSAKERELVSKAAREVEDILLQMPPNESVAVGESVDPDENKSWPLPEAI